jgi:hypothetical protein
VHGKPPYEGVLVFDENYSAARADLAELSVESA